MSRDKSLEIHIGESIIKSSDYEKKRDTKIDSKLYCYIIYIYYIYKYIIYYIYYIYYISIYIFHIYEANIKLRALARELLN